MWDLPRTGLDPVSPALAGGFLTAAPPGQSLYTDFNIRLNIVCFFLFFFKFYVFIYLFGCVGVFISVRGLSLVAASGGHS